MSMFRVTKWPLSSSILIVFFISGLTVQAQEMFGSGIGPAPSCGPNFIPQWQKAEIKAAIDEYYATNESYHVKANISVDDTLYPIYPQAGIWGGDVLPSNYVDLDPRNGLFSFDCNQFTYNGHNGVDTEIGTFESQEIGVPVYAVMDGRIINAVDGYYDRNTTWDNQPSNYVVIDHGNNLITYYYHLKRGSVSVNKSDRVSAGQQIGLIASSGISTGPHLHFETRINGNVIEPFHGQCQSNASMWMNQPPNLLETSLADFTITLDDLTQWQGVPYPTSSTGYILRGQQRLYFWVRIRHLPADSTYQVRFFRPDGRRIYNSSPRNNNNNEFLSAWWWFWWSFNFNVTGTWHIEFLLNDRVMAKLPFDVVSSEDEMINRPPNPIDVEFDPSIAEFDEIITCQVADFTLADDPDYDIVRYRFHWKRNGHTIRDVINAVRSDSMAKNLTQNGDRLTCEVTPSDGKLNSETVTAHMIIGGDTSIPDFELY